MKIGKREFDTSKTYIMGILNVTPDSFSDGGRFNTVENALRHTEQMIKDGADIIDIGGESTRPGYTKITDTEEIMRIVPVIEAICSRFDIPLSVDTYKSAVAKAALETGADLVNDIWGLKYDEKVAEITAKYNACICLMHNRESATYTDFKSDVLSDLRESIAIAKKYGISDDKIITDPGVGFAKNLEENLFITNNIDCLKTLGYPYLLGASRKSMIGLSLNLPGDERLEGTLATTVIACMKGAMFVRVHDVKENRRVIDMTEAVINAVSI